MNRVIIKGRLGKDPEMKTFDNGGQICNITVATDESYKNQKGEKVEQTEWHNVSFNGKVADVIVKYFNKGSEILLEGKLRTRSWEKDGEKKYLTEILADRFEFCGGGNQTNQQSHKAPQSEGQQEDDLLPF